MAAAVSSASWALLPPDLKRGDTAPVFSGRDIDGRAVALADFRGRTAVVLFAEAGQERSGQAAGAIARSLRDETLSERRIAWLMVYTKASDPEAIGRELAALDPGPLAIRDSEREAFEAYQVIALPTVVVVDAGGLIVHATAGLSRGFEQTIANALKLATGGMTAEEFDLALGEPDEAASEETRRAGRLANLARRLSHRGQHTMAESYFREAMELDPGLVHARLGLADLLIRTDRLDEAEGVLRSVLGAHPKSLDAMSALALVHAMRGQELELTRAEALASEVLERSPTRARAHYVLGLVHEKRGRPELAAACYRSAAELLLGRLWGGESGGDEADEENLP